MDFVKRKPVGRARIVPAGASQDSETCASCPPIRPVPGFTSSKENNIAYSSTKIERESCSWFEIHHLVRAIASQINDKRKRFDCILSISTGGLIPAKLLAEELVIDNIAIVPFRNKHLIESEMPTLKKSTRYLIVDDIYDTGKTYTQLQKKLHGFDCEFAFCLSRFPDHPGFVGRILNHDRWIVFPWEKEIK